MNTLAYIGPENLSLWTYNHNTYEASFYKTQEEVDTIWVRMKFKDSKDSRPVLFTLNKSPNSLSELGHGSGMCLSLSETFGWHLCMASLSCFNCCVPKLFRQLTYSSGLHWCLLFTTSSYGGNSNFSSSSLMASRRKWTLPQDGGCSMPSSS